MNFFQIITGNIIKWWHVHITPILHINNNKKGDGQVWGGDGSLAQEASGQGGAQTGYGQGSGDNTQGATASASSTSKSGNAAVNGASADALEILNRINREKDEVRLREIEAAEKKREEEARIASIMNSNKVDVNAFIEEGRSKSGGTDSSAGTEASSDTTSSASEEELRRAQEILDRLNREAAEDEAKKQAEIEAAKAEARAREAAEAKAAENAAENEAVTDSASDEDIRRAQEILDRLNREAAEDEAKKQAEIEAARERAREAGL